VKEAVRTPGEASASAHRRSESRYARGSRPRSACAELAPQTIQIRQKDRVARKIKQNPHRPSQRQTIEERRRGPLLSIMAPEIRPEAGRRHRRHGISIGRTSLLILGGGSPGSMSPIDRQVEGGPRIRDTLLIDKENSSSSIPSPARGREWAPSDAPHRLPTPRHGAPPPDPVLQNKATRIELVRRRSPAP